MFFHVLLRFPLMFWKEKRKAQNRTPEARHETIRTHQNRTPILKIAIVIIKDHDRIAGLPSASKRPRGWPPGTLNITTSGHTNTLNKCSKILNKRKNSEQVY